MVLYNRLKSNPQKCHLRITSKVEMEISISNCAIKNENRVKHLGIHMDGNLSFDFHVNQLCKNASKKLHALARTCKYMDIRKRRTPMKAFVTWQFFYCPLVWMFHSRNIEHRLNKIHKRLLQLVHENSCDLTFE